MQQLLKKLTVKGIMGVKVDTHLEEIKKRKSLPLCRIIGRADKARPDSSKLGDFVRFYGEFVGVNLMTGERFDSGSAILPGIAESAVFGMLGQLNDKGQAENTVEFAFEIAAKYDETAATKYVYAVTPLLEPKPSDPMKALLDTAGSAKALTDQTKKK